MENNDQKKPVKPATKKLSTAALRVSLEFRKKVLSDLSKLNKKPFGKRIRPEAYLARAVAKLTPEDFNELQQSSLSNQDRMEQSYREYISKNGSISRDEFLGKILTGEIAKTPNELLNSSEVKRDK